MLVKTPELRLANNVLIPQLGFGTWGLGRSGTKAILHALRAGYRHLDTADNYGTHGNIAEANVQSGLPRADLFITTKLWTNNLSAKRVGPAVDRFLNELNTDYIDLLLIHWPGNRPVAETLGAMDAARQAGKVRTLGVSNFDVELMQASLDTGFPVVNNQIEYNLNHRPDEVVAFCLDRQVTVTAYSPLERGTHDQERLLAEIARKYAATREEVLLNWLLQKGLIVIPRSADPAHIESNFHVLAWSLHAEAGAQLDQA